VIDEVQQKIASVLYIKYPNLYHLDWYPDRLLTIFVNEDLKWKELIGFKETEKLSSCSARCGLHVVSSQHHDQLLIWKLVESETQNLQQLVNIELTTKSRQMPCSNTSCTLYKKPDGDIPINQCAMQTTTFGNFGPIQVICLAAEVAATSSKIKIPMLLVIGGKRYKIVGRILATSSTGSHFTCIFDNYNKTYFAESRKRKIVEVVQEALYSDLDSTYMLVYVDETLIDV
jgi:hypothetical protein